MSNSWLGGYGHTSSDGLPSLTQPFSELQAEHTYLLSTLNVENYKATNLLRRLPALEHFLLGDAAPSQKRKTRKQLGWLKHRFEEASRQERTILHKLGQLTWELQKMERLRILEDERRILRQTSTWNETKFDPAVSEFCPQMEQPPHYVWHVPQVQWQNVPWQQPYSPVSEEYTLGWSPMNMRNNEHDAILREPGPQPNIHSNNNDTDVSQHTDKMSGTSLKKRNSRPRPRSNSMDGSSQSSDSRARRKSLPSLPDSTGKKIFWREEDETEDEEEETRVEEETDEKTERLQRDSGYEEYLGFYIRA